VIFLPALTSDGVFRIGGTVVGAALAAVTAVWEAVLTPWYVIVSGHVIRLPVAPLLAVVANIGIVWFTMRVTRHTVLSLLPAIPWIVVIFAAGSLTSDGDLIIEGTWVGLTTILLGAVAWAAGGYFVVGRANRRAAVAAVPSPASTAATRGTIGRKNSKSR
jgi:hypothetical protein